MRRARTEVAGCLAKYWQRHIHAHDCIPGTPFDIPLEQGCWYERALWSVVRTVSPILP